MFLSLIEVYDEVTHHNKAEGTKRFHLREIVLNQKSIAFMREDEMMHSYLQDGKLPEGLKMDQKFTRISISRGNIGQDITVVGDLKHIASLFAVEEKRKLMKG